MRSKATFFAGFATGYVLGSPCRACPLRADPPGRQVVRQQPGRAEHREQPPAPGRRGADRRQGQGRRQGRPDAAGQAAGAGSAGSTTRPTSNQPCRQQRPRPLARAGDGGFRWHDCAGSTARARDQARPARQGASPTSGRTARAVHGPRHARADHARWCCPRPGPTSGSARIRAATSRRSAPTPPAGGSTATTTSGASSATPRSTSACSPSPSGSRPRARRSWRTSTSAGMTRNRVLAAAFRLLDLGFFRVGGESYAEENGTSVWPPCAAARHRHRRPGGLRLHRQERQAARPGGRRRQRAQGRRRAAQARRPAARSCSPTRTAAGWHDITSADINGYLREVLGDEVSAKDFRTWHATVLTAVGLAVSTQAPTSTTARKRAVNRVVKEVSEYLGNTPAVCRSSYIDPRVIDLYDDGVTIQRSLERLGADADFGQPATHGQVEEAVLRLLRKPVKATTRRSRSQGRARPPEVGCGRSSASQLGPQGGDGRVSSAPYVRSGRVHARRRRSPATGAHRPRRRDPRPGRSRPGTGTRRLTTMLAITRSCTVSGSRPGSGSARRSAASAGSTGSTTRTNSSSSHCACPTSTQSSRRSAVTIARSVAATQRPALSCTATSVRSRGSRSSGRAGVRRDRKRDGLTCRGSRAAARTGAGGAAWPGSWPRSGGPARG